MFCVIYCSTLIWLTYSLLTCHRCFGNGFCHDPSHTDFPLYARNVTCSATSLSLDVGNTDLWSTEIQKALNRNFQITAQNSTKTIVTEARCITARVHEPHDSHTLRTCVIETRNEDSTSRICELIKERIESQNRYNGNFSCGHCTGNFCNVHTFSGSDTDTSENDTDVPGNDGNPPKNDTDTSGFTVIEPLGLILILCAIILSLL
ncbi:uncharacterized protein LOC126742621 isoform X1 [Anthonomus grandis grandis]|uniref:uncharacterized protein LOC126742621 isoform X1 n=1 Tax=Anthonomus grandis grandis TaxID=2921223 RepID=UPI0021665640|nr:uncharacterized protein LOC126742621 isoform X1 [Anthonomus grandis grandis]